jgi:hypothetical protein
MLRGRGWTSRLFADIERTSVPTDSVLLDVSLAEDYSDRARDGAQPAPEATPASAP